MKESTKRSIVKWVCKILKVDYRLSTTAPDFITNVKSITPLRLYGEYTLYDDNRETIEYFRKQIAKDFANELLKINAIDFDLLKSPNTGHFHLEAEFHFLPKDYNGLR